MSANTFLPPSPVIPGFLLITNITQTNPMVISITDSDENTYIAGQLVHLSVPVSYGMFQADQLTGEIVAINGTNFTVNIDASQFDAFVVPPVGQEQPATLAPAGSRNLQFSNLTTRVPFQSLGNQGN
jgi:hypothetical protein